MQQVALDRRRRPIKQLTGLRLRASRRPHLQLKQECSSFYNRLEVATMTLSNAQLASKYRLIALDITKRGLNLARRELRDQITSGRVNPTAMQTSNEQAGFKPTKIDTVMDTFMSREVNSADGKVTHYSEENMKNVYPSRGDIYAWCDPLDGTTNAFTLFGAYAIVLFFDRYNGASFDHLGGAIASFDGTVVSWEHWRNGNGEVWIDWPIDFFWPGSQDDFPSQHVIQNQDRRDTEPPFGVRIASTDADKNVDSVAVYPGIAQRIGSVASTTNRRAELFHLFDLGAEEPGLPKEHRLYLSTVAGNPFIAPLLLGQLGAMVETQSPKLHDAAYLIPLLLAGGVVVDLDDSNEIQVFRKFSQPNPAERKIGPFIASADEVGIRELIRRRRGPTDAG
jgi:hypothetical protein